MAKGYQVQELKQKIVDILSNSKTGLSGVEISEKLGINRVTMSKYLNIFATEGMIGQKNIGNVNLWFLEEGTEQFEFPADYFRVKTKYLELLTNRSEQKSYNLIRNCMHSNANTPKLMYEIILPAAQSVPPGQRGFHPYQLCRHCIHSSRLNGHAPGFPADPHNYGC